MIFIEDSGMNRKSAIRLLNQKDKPQSDPKKAGRKRKHDHPLLIDYVKKNMKYDESDMFKKIKTCTNKIYTVLREEIWSISRTSKKIDKTNISKNN
jgi:hypothetical protein